MRGRDVEQVNARNRIKNSCFRTLILRALSYTQRNAARVFSSFSLLQTQFSFSRPAPRFLNSKCICAHGHVVFLRKLK